MAGGPSSALDGMEAKALQIVRLDIKQNVVAVDDANLKVIGTNLRKSNADAVSIVAIMGTYRTGKSFLLDLLIRYLGCWEEAAANDARREDARRAAYERTVAAHLAEGKSEEEGIAAGKVAAEEAAKLFPDSPFPPPANAEWRLDGPRLPPPSWALDGDATPKISGIDGGPGFEWRGGREKCTEGIWLWSRPFMIPKDGRRIAVMLMDTQGAWDGMMSKEQSATIFGLTALLSSKLIYNLQNMLTEDKIDNLDYFTTFAQAACSGLSSEGAPFGHLEFLVRDWSWYKDGFDVARCKEMMSEHLRDLLDEQSAPEGRKETVERLRQIFSSVSCFGLPHPGLKVLKPQFKGDFSDIESDFLQLLDEFTRSFFRADDFPKASAPLGIEISTSTFENTITNFVQAFRDNKGSAVHLREAFVKVEIFKHRDQLLEQFNKRLASLAPSTKVIDPEVFSEEAKKIKKDFQNSFESKIKSFKLEDEDKQIQDFMKSINEKLEARGQANMAEVEAANMKLFATPFVGSGLFFMTGHPYVDAILLAGFGYVQAERHAKSMARAMGNEVPFYDPRVLQTLAVDGRRFAEQRVRDVQAMGVAAQRCTPASAMDQVMAQTNKLAGSAAAAAVAAKTASGSNNGGGAGGSGNSNGSSAAGRV